MRQYGAEVPPLQDRFDVVPCDPTQSLAIAEAREGANYIIQGPPGTGKSQTITNLIADFVVRGKRVLFVCEKRAAIDVVYARLRQCGLASLCALIHDSQSDKKEFVLDLKQGYEQLLGETRLVEVSQQRASVLRKLRHGLAQLEAFESSMEAQLPGCDGLSGRRFLNRCIELLDARCALGPEELERLPTYDQWWRNSEQLANLDSLIRFLEPSGVFSKHPLRRLSPALAKCECAIERVIAACRKASAALDALEGIAQRSGTPADQWQNVKNTKQLLDYALQVSGIARNGNLALLDTGSDHARDFAKAMREVMDAERASEVALQETVAWRHKLSPADLKTALEQASAWKDKWFNWLFPRWWHLRRVLSHSYDFSVHAVQPSWLQVLTALQVEYDARRAVGESLRSVQSRFAIDVDPRQFHKDIERVSAEAPSLPQWLRRLHTALIKAPKAEVFLERALAAREPVSTLTNELTDVLADFEELSFSELGNELLAVGGAASDVPNVLGVLRELSQLPPAIGAILRQTSFTIPQAEAAIAFRTWDTLVRGRREVAQFDRQMRDRSAALLEKSYDRWQSHNASEILHRQRAQFLEHVRISNQSITQLSAEKRELKRRYSDGRRTLEHEFGKSMRYKAIRELVEGDAALVIRDLKPVWLMSPLSVSDTLPLDAKLFDVVIFDEASQVPLEESIPTLFRGQHVIIVGDEMQLPPTDFFSTKQSEESDDLVVEEGGERTNYDLNSDSLLNHAARNLAATMLGWHYRSRSESLISVSNWAFYDGRLLTVPDHQLTLSTTEAEVQRGGSETTTGVEHLLARPVSFHHLKDGIYDERRNRREAQYIAELVCGLLKKCNSWSIGVIAFSEAQQSEIEAALNRLAQEDEEFRGLYDAELEREVEGQFVGLLVKNLENIQGDERDIVILSICYGTGPNGRMLMNFGPINKSGGEKRLNVAFSRAKHHMAVVSSIQHSAITNDYNDGAACLKNYLRYVESLSNGDSTGAKRVLSGISRWHESNVGDGCNDDPVCRQLASALRQNGYLVDFNVGHSHFRVDVAVRRGQEPRYCLGILVDTPIKYEQFDAMEREMMRPRLLRSFGWRLTCVLANDWYVDRDREVQRILALLERTDDDELTATEDSDDSDEFVDSLLEMESSPAEAVSPTQSECQHSSNQDHVDVIDTLDQCITVSTLDITMPVGEPVVTGSEPIIDGSTRYFEYCDDRSNKFWEISLAGSQYTVRFGRIGTKGQSQSKIFSNAESAEREASRLIREKSRKGYREIPRTDRSLS